MDILQALSRVERKDKPVTAKPTITRIRFHGCKNAAEEKFYLNCLSRDMYNYETYITMDSLKKLKEKRDLANKVTKLQEKA